MILTLACGKFRFNKNEFGAINGIPRLLDVVSAMMLIQRFNWRLRLLKLSSVE